MDHQLSLYDIGVCKPFMWDCVKTCIHYTEKYQDDFPIPADFKRCTYGRHQVGIGTSGKDMHEIRDGGLLKFECIFYKSKFESEVEK